MTQRTVKYECKAYKIFEAPDYYKDKDVIAIAYESRNHGTLHRRYTLGSVARYAMDNGHCPLMAIETAKLTGGQLHYAYPKSSILTSHDRPQEYAFMQEHGDEIKFHGERFEIVPTANHNIRLNKLTYPWRKK